MTALFTFFTPCDSRGGTLRFSTPKTHQRVDAEWPDLAPLDQFGAAMRLRPGRKALKRKFRPQADRACLLRQQSFDCGGKTPLGVKMIDKNDLTARPQHPRT